jgi:hypothetical protein
MVWFADLGRSQTISGITHDAYTVSDIHCMNSVACSTTVGFLLGSSGNGPQPTSEQIDESLWILFGYPVHAVRDQLECDVFGELFHHIVSELRQD